MQGRPIVGGYAGERSVQLGRKEQKTVQLGRKNDRTGSRKKGEAHQQPRTTLRTYPIRPRRMASLPLPSEVFMIVAEFLVGANQFGTLANLNVANRLVREATNIALWTTVILDSKIPRWNVVGAYRPVVLPFRDMIYVAASWQKRGKQVFEVPGLPTNLKYVRYVLLSHDHDIDEYSVSVLFPYLRVQIKTNIDNEIYGGVTVTIQKPVTYHCLFLHLLQISLRPTAKDMSVTPQATGIWILLLGIKGALFDFESVRSQHHNQSRFLQFSAPGFHLNYSDYAHKTIPSKRMTGLEETRRFIDSFFGLLKLVGYAKPLEEKVEMASISWGILAPEQVYLTESVSIGSCPAETPLLVALKRDFPAVASEYPEVLPLCLSFVVYDQPSPELLRDTIQSLQGAYAKRPDLIPFIGSNNVVEIQGLVQDPTAEKYLQAVLSVGWNDDGKLNWLMAEVRWSRYQIGSHVQDETAWWSEVVYLDNCDHRHQSIATEEIN